MSMSPMTVPRPAPLRLPRVCVAIIGRSAGEMMEKAESAVRDNPFIEFRLDYLTTPSLALPHLKRFMSYHPEVVAVCTCRRAVNGGKFRGPVANQVSLLAKAADSGCQMVDLELQSAIAGKAGDLQKLRSQAALVVLSFHDFKATRKLDETFRTMLKYPADYYKLVTTATCLYDNVVMMKFVEEQSQRYSVVGVCMGEQGIISRVLGVRAGSAFTFAAGSPGEETAPGQIAFKTLRDVYRIEQVDAATRVFGVAGDPIAQSLSPVMMNAAFRRENVNAVYLALHAQDLDDLLKCVRDIPIHGLSVTMPYKEAIVEHLDNSDVPTQKTGACNTVVRMQDGKLYGFNTDVAGVVGPLQQRINLANAKILVIGAGGSARAAIYGLKERGAEVYVLARKPAQAQKLARQLRAKAVKRTDLRKLTFEVIINATPVGMTNVRESPPLKENEIRTRYLLDMVYTEPETRLMKLARARGAEIIPGSEVFVTQGARQFEIWTGKPAPLAEMQYEVRNALEARRAAAKTPAKKKKR